MTESSSDQESSNSDSRHFKVGEIEARIDSAHIHQDTHENEKQIAKQSVLEESSKEAVSDTASTQQDAKQHETKKLHQAMRIQATELAEHLQSWQTDLDRRNEQICTQIAELESERRTSQISNKIRYDNFQEQKSDLDKLRYDLSLREESLVVMEKQNEIIAQQLFESQQQLASERATLQAEREEFNSRSQKKQQEWALKRHEFQNTFRGAMGHLKRRQLHMESERNEMIQSNKNEPRTWAALKVQQKTGFKQQRENLIELEQALQTQQLDLENQSEIWQQKMSEIAADLMMSIPAGLDVPDSISTIEKVALPLMDPSPDQLETAEESEKSSSKSNQKKLKKSLIKKQRILKKMKREVREMMVQSLETKLAAELLCQSLLEEMPESVFQERLAFIRDDLVDQYHEILQDLGEARAELAFESEQVEKQNQSLQKSKIEQEQYFSLKESHMQEQLQTILHQQTSLKKDRIAIEQRSLSFTQRKTKLESEVILLQSKLERAQTNTSS